MTTPLSLQRERGLEWTVVSRALPGEAVSGDLHLVMPSRDGVLIAVIDGLGHGDEATRAARKAADVIAGHVEEPLIALVRRCHEALRDTRGAVMTVVAVNLRERTATALGVGNVEAMIVRPPPAARARESVLLRNGVIGYRLPELQTSEFPLSPGDLVVFATDGVREDFADRVNPHEPLPVLVERILAQKFRGTDDALVLAGKILDDDED